MSKKYIETTAISDAEVKISTLQGIEIKLLQVPRADGGTTPVRMAKINDLLLITVSDLCMYFNEARSTLHKHFSEGRLKRYHPNGAEKKDGGPSKVMVDMNAWLKLNMKPEDLKPKRKLKPKYVIRMKRSS